MLLPSLLKSLKNYARYTQTKTELLSLTDHELRDIGLNRGDIERMSLKSYQSRTSAKTESQPTRDATGLTGKHAHA